MTGHDLSPDAVRRLLGRDAYPADYTPAQPVEAEQARRRGLDLKVFLRRMHLHENFILCRYLEGYTPEQIAVLLSSHPETIRLRIRRAHLFPTDHRGKPPKGASHPLVSHYRLSVARTGGIGRVTLQP